MKRHVVPLVIVAALLIAATSIGVGFATDDHGFHALVAHHRRSALDLFRFAGTAEESRHLVAYGVLPWWTAPDFQLRFLRPLTGALFALDVAVFGDRPLGYHLHSLAWFAALLAVVWQLYRRVLPRESAVVAMAIFALRAANVVPYAWIAARHVLVGATPAALALVVWIAAGARRRRWLSLPLLALGLAGSEAALAIVPFFVFLERRKSAPFLGLAAGYLLLYRTLGFGARASGGYHDPSAGPLRFLGVAVTRIPMLLADALAGIPVSHGSDDHAGFYVVAGLAGVAVCVVLARSAPIAAPERAALRWLVPAAVCGLLVGATGLPGGRVLVVPDLGFAALLGVLVRHGLRARWLSRGLGALLALAHLVVAPLASLLAIHVLARTARAAERIAHTVDVGEPAPRAFVIAASDPFVFLYPRSILAATEPGRVRCLTPLSGARADHRVTTVGPHAIAVESLGAPIVSGFATLFRDPHVPFAVGDTVRDCAATIRVDAVERGQPTKITVTFDDRAPTVLLAWDGDRLARFELPAPGDSAIVPWHRGPSEH